jgi:hypothetical protein
MSGVMFEAKRQGAGAVEGMKGKEGHGRAISLSVLAR